MLEGRGFWTVCTTVAQGFNLDLFASTTWPAFAPGSLFQALRLLSCSRLQGEGYHLAVSSKGGRVAVLDADTLQPLVHMYDSREAIDELKYSPRGGPGILAAASHDSKIYLYRVSRGYQLIGRCSGHSGTINHLDWSLPIPSPSEHRGKFILQSSDGAWEILYWDPETGRAITSNQRNAPWHTYTNRLGFSVMGVWADGADNTDINSTCRSHRGAPQFPANPPAATLDCPQHQTQGNPLSAFYPAASVLNRPHIWLNLAGAPTYDPDEVEMTIARRSIAANVGASNAGRPLDLDTNRGAAMMSMDSTPAGMRSALVQYPPKGDCSDGVPTGGYLVTADDFSFIKLFNYPTVADDAPFKAFRGHSSHVCCVRFSCDDRRVVSVGGHDRGIYQWKTVGIALEDDVHVSATRWPICWFSSVCQ